MKTIVAITGATGPALGLEIIKFLCRQDVELSVIFSETALDVASYELETKFDGSLPNLLKNLSIKRAKAEIKLYRNSDLFAPIASGSYLPDKMLIVPCSVGTAGAIAHGAADNLIERAADVIIKQGRLLVLAVRETPLSAIHLENLLKLARLGVRIVPPVLGFYCKPKSLDDEIAFVVGKILDASDIPNDLYPRWKEGL